MLNKSRFPIFKEYPELIYLDNAATTQKPEEVIKALVDFYTKYNANVHRGLYPLSEKATELFEEARKKIAKFINADPEEIIFTSGTTEGINGLAQSLYSSGIINPNPKILLSEGEHHSNLLPWQQLPEAELSFIPYKTSATKVTELTNGTESYDSSNMYGISKDEHYYPIAAPFDVLALNLVSNVTGAVTDINEISEMARSHNQNQQMFIMLDLAQAVGHMKIDVKKLGIDFAVFSGHKMYGPMGVGVLWGKREHLEKMNPFKTGGGMIREVKMDKSTWAPIPARFEAGTPNVANVIALAEAAGFIENIGFDAIEKHEEDLRSYLVTKLSELNEVKIYHPDLSEKAAAVISISFNKAHPHDIAQYLGEEICVRAGHHCVQILHREVLQIPASLRISFGIYNSKAEVDQFIRVLKEALLRYTK